MDSLTQFTLGAAVGQAVLGRKLGWRAALTGGLVATIPDLDVMVPFDDPVADFTYHQGASHSLLVLTVVSPLLAWVCHWCSSRRIATSGGGGFFVGLRYSRTLIDAATICSAQLFWPITEYPVGTGSIYYRPGLYLAIAARRSSGARRGSGQPLGTVV